MENKNDTTVRLKNLLATNMKANGATEDEIAEHFKELEDKMKSIQDGMASTTFETPRIHTDREEKLYNTAEKVLDKTFDAYGKVKGKTNEVVSATKEKTRSLRSWIAKKIEPKS